MRKAFDQNVSRAKPRLRLSGLLSTTEAEAVDTAASMDAALPEEILEEAEASSLAEEIRDRVERAKTPRQTAAEAVQQALSSPAPSATAFVRPEPVEGRREIAGHVAQTVAAARETVAPTREVTQAREMIAPTHEVVTARRPAAAPAHSVEVQTEVAPVPQENPEPTPSNRREKLKERLKAVRENPRLDPLPSTVVETGHLAVERISGLYQELTRLKSQNLSLAQELEVARRAAEKATEEAHSRMEEARRLATEGQKRAELLAELERELAALEGERDEVLASVQEARESLQVSFKEKESLQALVSDKERALSESLLEEEKLAGELEVSHDETAMLRRSLDAIAVERDSLSKQVTQLTSERAELLEARRALEAVHRALAAAK